MRLFSVRPSSPTAQVEKFSTLRETVLKIIDPTTNVVPTKVIKWTTIVQVVF